MNENLFKSGKMGVAVNILMAAHFFHVTLDAGSKEALFMSALDFTTNAFPDMPRGEILKNNESTRYLVFSMILASANESTSPFIDENWIDIEDQDMALDGIDLLANFDYELQQAQSYIYQKYSVFVSYRKHDGTPAITDTYIAHLQKQAQNGTIDESGKEVLKALNRSNNPQPSSGCLSVFLLFIVCIPVIISLI